MRRRWRHPVVLLLCLCHQSHLCAQEAVDAQRDRSTIDVSVDPRIELLAAVQLISGYGERTRLITRHDFRYKKRMTLQFSPYADHDAVRLFDSMSRRGFSFDAPVAAILHCSNPPELEVLAEVPDGIVARAGGREQLDAFLAALRDFARETDFAGFFENHASEYEKMIAPVRAHLADIDIGMLEAYYGTKQSGYHIILAPLFHPGGFGPSVRLEEDQLPHIYSVMGPHGTESDVPTFGAAEDFRYLVWHEFSHSFVNPIVDAHGEEVDRFSALFEPLRQRMSRQAYKNWRTCVYEHIVRAATCRFTARELGEEAAKEAIDYESSRAFVYVEELCGKLRKYESNRDQYETLNDFFPVLLQVFEQASEGPDGEPIIMNAP